MAILLKFSSFSSLSTFKVDSIFVFKKNYGEVCKYEPKYFRKKGRIKITNWKVK